MIETPSARISPDRHPATTGANESAPADGSPMLVAVEASRLEREKRGIGRYVRALLPRLLAARPGLRFLLFVKPRDLKMIARRYAENPETRDRVEVRSLRALRRSSADVFWYPWNTVTPRPGRGAVVTTVHDVAPIVLPDPRFLRWRKNHRWRVRFAETAKRSTLLVVDSAFTAAEVHRTLGFPRDRMRVVLLAADDFPIPPDDRDPEALMRLGVQRPFVLAVGAADPRKNLALLQRAMPQVLAAHPRIKLVLAGPRPDTSDDPARPWEKTLGFVSEEDLAALYRSAEMLVMPSTYEGFGLPMLEAMQLGTPVIGANASSLPEVGGHAARWVDPHDPAQLAGEIRRVLSDAGVRAAMRTASLAQAARFSWDETARQTIHAFEDAVALHAQQR